MQLCESWSARVLIVGLTPVVSCVAGVCGEVAAVNRAEEEADRGGAGWRPAAERGGAAPQARAPKREPLVMQARYVLLGHWLRLPLVILLRVRFGIGRRVVRWLRDGQERRWARCEANDGRGTARR